MFKTNTLTIRPSEPEGWKPGAFVEGIGKIERKKKSKRSKRKIKGMRGQKKRRKEEDDYYIDEGDYGDDDEEEEEEHIVLDGIEPVDVITLDDIPDNGRDVKTQEFRWK